MARYRDFRSSHDSHPHSNRRVSYSHSQGHRRSLSTNSDLSDHVSDMQFNVPPSATPDPDPSVFPDPEKRTKEGFLDYRTSSQRPFKRRYFVLTRNFLLGAASADPRKLEKVIHLENATSFGLVENDPLAFFIHIRYPAQNRTKKFTFRSDLEDESRMWIAHVRAATRLTIHDIYQFVEPIGVSESGTRVWRARVLPSFERRRRGFKTDIPSVNDEFVAIKMIEKSLIDKSNLRNEIITMKRLDHPCVVKLYDVFEDKQYLCLIMEYCDGGELYDVVANQQGGRDEAESCDVMHQIARGVRYLHSRSVVHRDLKPENILCVSNPSTGRLAVKIADFGISKAIETDRYHSMQTPCGTLTYTAPEILRGERYDKTCDYWSLGVIMHALVVGYSPWWMASTPTEIQRMIVNGQVELDPNDWAHVSEDVQNLVLRLLHPDPRQRATVDDILNLTWREMVSSSSYYRLMEWGLESEQPSILASEEDGQMSTDYHLRSRTRLVSAELSTTAIIEEDDVDYSVRTPRTPRDVSPPFDEEDDDDDDSDERRSITPLDGIEMID